jgi:hypothetical protein
LLARPTRAYYTKHFKSFKINGATLSKGCDHWTTERWIEKIKIYAQYGLNEQEGFDIDINNKQDLI